MSRVGENDHLLKSGKQYTGAGAATSGAGASGTYVLAESAATTDITRKGSAVFESAST